MKTRSAIVNLAKSWVGKNEADGIFGSKTDSAVRKYQKAKLLEVDGIVGKVTMSSLLGV